MVCVLPTESEKLFSRYFHLQLMTVFSRQGWPVLRMVTQSHTLCNQRGFQLWRSQFITTLTTWYRHPSYLPVHAIYTYKEPVELGPSHLQRSFTSSLKSQYVYKCECSLMKLSGWTRSLYKTHPGNLNGSLTEQVCHYSHMEITKGFPGKPRVKAMCS